MRARAAVLTLASVLALAAPLAAQQGFRRQPTTTVRGVVLDAVRGDPLPNAMIRLVEDHRGVLTDSLGRFTVTDVSLGPQTIAVKEYGYEEVDTQVDLRANHPLLRIELQPGPIALEGFDIVADRLAEMKQRMENRRNAAAVAVHTFDQDRLTRTAARDMRDFLVLEANVRPRACFDRGASSFGFASTGTVGWPSGSCVERRGGVTGTKVYIDENWTIGGLDELELYQPYEFYSVEVYASGAEIRAYTHEFMERMARGPMTLIPIGLWFNP